MADQWDTMAASFMRALRARRRSPRTLLIYREAIDQLSEHLEGEAVHDPAEVTRQHVEGFLIAQFDRGLAPATVNNRYRSLFQFFKWLEIEEEITANPMRTMSPPAVPERLVPVLTDEQLAALLKACDGKDFASRRDTAMVRLFLDSGVRRAEMAGMLLADLALEDQVVVVIGKGDRERAVPFGDKTAAAIDRYVRLRRKERQSLAPELWLGAKGKGAITPDGIAQMLERRGKEAGFEFRLHPHMLRHTFASTWLGAGGGETDLMQLAGWKSRQMLSRYGASAAGARARSAHRRMGLGDRF